MPSFFFHVSIDFDSRTQPSKHDLALSSNLLTADPQQKRSTTPPATKQGQTRRSNKAPTESNLPVHYIGSCGRSVLNGNGQHDVSQSSLDHRSSLNHTDDWRWGRITMQGTDMHPSAQQEDDIKTKTSDSHSHSGIGAGTGGLATKGRFEPVELGEEELGWGILRLYRDAEETPGLYNDITTAKSSKNGRNAFSRQGQLKDVQSFKDEDCTTLCILAVPSYLTPSDFLGFVGEKTRDEVSHFRMIRTERSNRYMVIMKFRSGKRAREWRKEWNGRGFNDMDVSLSITGNPSPK